MVAVADPVELGATVGDGAGEQVEPPGGTLGVGHGRDARRQGKALHQRDDIDAALLEHGALGQIHPVHLEFGEAIFHRAAGAREKRGAHAIGHAAEPQIEARGLDLSGDRGNVGGNGARGDQRPDPLRCENSGHPSLPRQAFRAKKPASTEAGFLLVGPARFELATFRPPDGRANQAAPRARQAGYITRFAAGASGKRTGSPALFRTPVTPAEAGRARPAGVRARPAPRPAAREDSPQEAP